MKVSDLAKELGIAETTVRAWCKKNNIAKNERGGYILTEDVANKLREKYKQSTPEAPPGFEYNSKLGMFVKKSPDSVSIPTQDTDSTPVDSVIQTSDTDSEPELPDSVPIDVSISPLGTSEPPESPEQVSISPLEPELDEIEVSASPSEPGPPPFKSPEAPEVSDTHHKKGSKIALLILSVILLASLCVLAVNRLRTRLPAAVPEMTANGVTVTEPTTEEPKEATTKREETTVTTVSETAEGTSASAVPSTERQTEWEFAPRTTAAAPETTMHAPEKTTLQVTESPTRATTMVPRTTKTATTQPTERPLDLTGTYRENSRGSSKRASTLEAKISGNTVSVYWVGASGVTPCFTGNYDAPTGAGNSWSWTCYHDGGSTYMTYANGTLRFTLNVNGAEIPVSLVRG